MGEGGLGGEGVLGEDDGVGTALSSGFPTGVEFAPDDQGGEDATRSAPVLPPVQPFGQDQPHPAVRMPPGGTVAGSLPVPIQRPQGAQPEAHPTAPVPLPVVPTTFLEQQLQRRLYCRDRMRQHLPFRSQRQLAFTAHIDPLLVADLPASVLSDIPQGSLIAQGLGASDTASQATLPLVSSVGAVLPSAPSSAPPGFIPPASSVLPESAAVPASVVVAGGAPDLNVPPAESSSGGGHSQAPPVSSQVTTDAVFQALVARLAAGQRLTPGELSFVTSRAALVPTSPPSGAHLPTEAVPSGA